MRWAAPTKKRTKSRTDTDGRIGIGFRHGNEGLMVSVQNKARGGTPPRSRIARGGATPPAEPRTEAAGGGERGAGGRLHASAAPIEQRSLARQVEERIRQMILAGKLACGERISEEGLARAFDVSRTPIREALHALEQGGLVRIRPRSSAHVNRITAGEARQVAAVRAQLETLAARELAARRTDADLSELARLADRCEAALGAGDLAGAFEADSRFHLEIAARSGNRFLFESLQRLDAFVMLYRLTFCRTPARIAGNVKRHRRILDALRRQDAKAAVTAVAQHALSMGEEAPNE
jgi:DNA-binding GntR family transcriptional regulator